MSLLPEEVNNTLLEILQGLVSSDNELRSRAERSLENDWYNTNGVEMLLLFFAEQAASGANDLLRSFSAVIFRRYALKMPPDHSTSMTASLIGSISEPVRAKIRTILYDGFVGPQSNSVRHKLADAISEVAKADISPPGTWDNLLPTLYEAAKSGDVSFRGSAFRVFAAQPSLIVDYVSTVLPIFESGFTDADDTVRIAATDAFVAFFQRVPKKEWASFSPLLPSLLNGLPKYLDEGKESALTSELESLIELVSLAPKMFKPMLPTIIEFCSTITKNQDLDPSTRLASLELLTTFCEASPNMCKLQPSYLETMVALTLQLMTEVCIDDEDAAEWNSNNDRNSADEEEYDAARNSLDRAALALGGKVLVSPLFQFLTQMFSSANWRERQAALMALSSAAEGCSDVLITEIPNILDLVLPLLDDPHPRVQYACCNALGQMSTDFADVIQKNNGDRILPALISKLNEKSAPRVQTHAAAALVNFSENASKDTLEPYLDDLLSNLLTLLQSSHRYVQEQVLTTIAIVADAAETKFIKYYDTLMPLLFNVLKLDVGKENRLLKAKSIECSSLIAAAVGKEKFSQHSQELIQIYAHIQKTIEGDDDPVKSYLDQAWSTICGIIGADFLPYLPEVLPSLIEQAKAEQIIRLVDEGDDVNQDEQWDVYPLGGKHVALHTSLLDDKVAAMDILKSYAEVLQGSFYPYVGNIVKDILLPALDFYFHDGVRETAAGALPVFLTVVKQSTGSKSNDTLTLWNLIADKLILSLEGEPLTDILVSFYTAFYNCLVIVGGDSLSDKQLFNLVKSIDANLQAVYQRIKERDEAEKSEEQFDEGLDEENNEFTDEELLDEINKTVSTVFKFSKAKFVPAFQELASTISALLLENNKTLKICGLCLVLDLIEHSGTNSVIFKDLFINPVGEALTSPQASIREIASYIVGVAALNGGPEYSDFCVAALVPLFKMISVPDSKSDDNITATENAVTGTAKVLHVYHDRVNNYNALVENWIQGLPIVVDSQCAPFSYSFLVHLIETNHPAVEKKLQKVIDSIFQALINGSIGFQTAEKSVAAAKLLLANVPQLETLALINRYSTEEQQLIQKWFS